MSFFAASITAQCRRGVSVSLYDPLSYNVVKRQILKELTIVFFMHPNRLLILYAFDRGVATFSEPFRSLTIITFVKWKSAPNVTAEVKRFRHAHFRSRKKEIIDQISPLSSTSLPKFVAILIFSREKIPPQFHASRSVSPLYLSPLIG